MKRYEFCINKMAVYDEVAKTTSYAGAKKTDEEGAYERIFTTDADRLALERFWVDACDMATDCMTEFINKVNVHAVGSNVDLEKNFEIELRMSNRFDENLKGSIETLLFSYFVEYIVAMWYMYTNKEESSAYATKATGSLDGAMKMLYYKKPPQRAMTTTGSNSAEMEEDFTRAPGA